MSPRTKAAPLSGLPQVNLLPPEVRQARGLARTKRWLGASVVMSILLAVGLVVLAGMAQSEAEQELRLADDDTARLNAEQAKYAEVPLVLGRLSTIKDARALGMSTEVVWPQYLSAIAATAPEGLSIDTIGVAGATPMALPVPPVSPLQAPSVATVTFTAESLTLPDTAAWLDGLETIPGFADGWFSSAVVSEVEGVTLYTVAATVQIDERAYARRFVSAEEERA